MGIDCKLRGMLSLTAANIILHSPKAKTLLKARRCELIDHFKGHRYKIGMYWPPIKICLRNKYRIKDVSMWFDYLKLFEHYRKDLHNTHYVCPKNLKKAHDPYVTRKKRDDEKERKAKEIQQLLKLRKDAENYIKEKSKFFDLKMPDGGIVVAPLKSLEGFQQKGEIMHHCVFTNKYYRERDSFILSVRIGKKYAETVEISLKTFSIVQSRRTCNSNTEYHNRIIGLVKKDMNLVRQKLAAWRTMTYIGYISQFRKMNRSVGFSLNEVFLHFYLLNGCNIRGWQNLFEHPNKTIVLATGISERTVIEVRNRLQ